MSPPSPALPPCLRASAETEPRLLGLPSQRNEQQINAGLIKDDWKLLIGAWEGSPASRSQDEYGFSRARDCKHFSSSPGSPGCSPSPCALIVLRPQREPSTGN